MIGVLMRGDAGPDYYVLRHPVTDEYEKRHKFSVHKMLAEEYVRTALLLDEKGKEWGVT